MNNCIFTDRGHGDWSVSPSIEILNKVEMSLATHDMSPLRCMKLRYGRCNNEGEKTDYNVEMMLREAKNGGFTHFHSLSYSSCKSIGGNWDNGHYETTIIFSGYKVQNNLQ